MSDGDIRALDERTIERIAAGEVVERPASVVKELVENSIDAGADRIAVTVEAGGTERIRVTDDGRGIIPDELPRAVERHTTSKLRGADDLATGIETLGFRGEALHTIGAVSRMTISTRPPDASEGARIAVSGGETGPVEPTGVPPGTTVEVEDLFYNTPARRSFLGTTETEFDHVNRIVTEYALASPDVAVSLTHDDREVFATPGRGDLREVVLAVWGREVAEAMVPVSVVGERGPLDALDGLVSDPETTRSRPRYVATFVNGRAVRSPRIREGLIEAYGHQLAPDRYPFAVLFCDVPHDAVDVNVHPRKTEVRFDDPTGITSAVEDAVEAALLGEGLVRSTAARGRGAPEETPVTAFGETTTSTSLAGRGSARKDTTQTEQMPTSSETFQPATTQRTMAGDEPSPDLERLPSLRLLGQLAGTYIVAESEDGLVLVDQHAADERINFERLRSSFTTQTITQELVEPVDIELTGDETAAFHAVADALARIGFDAEAIGDGQVSVRGVPAVFDDAIDPEHIREALAGAIASVNPGGPVERIAEDLMGDMACHPAITGNERLREGSMIGLLEALDACENPYACPHGRPTIVRVDGEELAERFERDYPGHTTRRSSDDPPSA